MPRPKKEASQAAGKLNQDGLPAGKAVSREDYEKMKAANFAKKHRKGAENER